MNRINAAIANACMVVGTAIVSALVVPPAHAQTTVAGVTPSSFRVTQSGTAEHSIPIQVPPGTGGIQPNLGLVYNSQGANGWLGVGWNLAGLSTIARCPRTMAQDGVRGGVNYDANDRYCLDGQRLLAISGSYGADGTEYRTELETFSKVVSYGAAGNGPAWFKVWTKSGQIMEYGNTADSRIEAQGKTSVRVWALNKMSDLLGNYLSIGYNEDSTSGDFTPNRIDYTGNSNTGSSPQQSVTFSYVTRSDQTPFYQVGSLVKTTQVMSVIKTYSGTTQVREYRLAYQSSVASERSLLNSVTECAGPSGPCLPQLTFGWQGAATGYVPWDWSSSSIALENSYPHYLADVNGDGKADLIQVSMYSSGGWVGLSNGNGSFQIWTWYSTAIGAVGSYDHYFADVNGDGKADLIMIQKNIANIYVGLSNGDGSFQTWTWSSTDIGAGSAFAHYLADVNGDGKADLIEVAIGTSGGRVALANGDGSFQTWTWYRADIGAVGSYNHYFVDVNGDGKADWIMVQKNINNGYVGLSNGDGSFDMWTWSSINIGQANGYNHYFADVNGDGKADWIQVAIGTNGGWVGLSRGDGSFGSNGYPWDWYSSNIGQGNGYLHYHADVNGDGKADWIQMAIGTNGGWIGYSNGDGSFSTWDWYSSNIGQANGYAHHFADVNGDGKVDWIQIGRGASVGYVGLALGPAPDLVTTFNASSGAVTTLVYKALTDSGTYTKDSDATYPKVDLQPAAYVVASATASNGIGGTKTTSHAYGGLKGEMGTGRGSLGFRFATATDTQTGIKVRSEHSQEWPYVGAPSLMKKTQSSGAVISQVVNSYACISPASGASCVVAPGNRYFPFLSQSVESGADLNGAVLPTVTRTNSSPDIYGNVGTISVTTGDGYSRTTTNTYANDVSNWLLGRLTRRVVQNTVP